MTATAKAQAAFVVVRASRSLGSRDPRDGDPKGSGVFTPQSGSATGRELVTANPHLGMLWAWTKPNPPVLLQPFIPLHPTLPLLHPPYYPPYLTSFLLRLR